MASKRVYLIAGGVAVGAYFLFPGSAPRGNLFETEATKNVGKAFSSAGGSTNHTPGYASKRGDSESTASRQENQNKGVGSPHFDEHLSAQKAGQPGVIGKAFNSAQYGNEKGK